VPSASGPVFIFCTPGLVFGGTGDVELRFLVLRSPTRFWRYWGRRVLFSCFAHPNSFSAVPRTSGPIFLFCTPRLVFGGTEGVGSRFHVFRAQTHFPIYRGRGIPFSCFACPDSFSIVPMASGPVFMLSSPRLIFGATEGVGSYFHVLRSQTHFRRYQRRRARFHVLRPRTRFRRY
jgi:hypothetical protein